MKKYEVIYADPPWKFNNKNTGGSMKSGALAKYNTLSIDELKKLDIQSITADDCVLFMWWVNSQPQEALDLVKAWGFKLKNMNGFVWVKLTSKLLLWFGMGFWTRAGSESCLIATKGKPKPFNRSVRAVVIKAVNFFHSKKPDEVRNRIMKLCGYNKPKIELFARNRYYGWSAWGDEVESNIIIPWK